MTHKPLRGAFPVLSHRLVPKYMCLPLIEFTGDIVNDVVRKRVYSANAPLIWLANGMLITPDAGAKIALPNNMFAGWSEFTVVARLGAISSISAQGFLLSGLYGLFWQNSLYHTTDRRLGWYTRDTSTGLSGGRDNDLVTSASLDNSIDNNVAFRYSVMNAEKSILIEGDIAVTSSTSVDPLNDNDGIVCNLLYDVAGGHICRFPIKYFYIYDCALSDHDIKLLHSDPYAIFRRPNPAIYYSATAGSTNLLTIMQNLNQFNGGAI